jgi:putative ABC transport system permease protein
MATVQSILDNVTLAISIVGGIALTSGVLILIGAVAMTKFQRVYEAAILRTLGAAQHAAARHHARARDTARSGFLPA